MSGPVRKELIEEYRALVAADTSPAAFERSIALVENVGGFAISIPEIQSEAAELEREETIEEAHRRNLSESLRTFMRGRFDEARLQRRAKRAQLQVRANIIRAASAVSFPAFLATQPNPLPRARESLLLDAALIVFHQACFGLLPIIPDSLRAERALLLDSFLEFSESLPNADRERVRALVHQANGDAVLAGFHFRHALNATSPKEHEFITLLQMAWSHALEHNRYVEATGLLLENASRVRNEDYEELKSMLMETLEFRRAA